MMNKLRSISPGSRSARFVGAIAAILTVGLAVGLITPPTASAQDAGEIVIQMPGLYPEGMDYDVNADRFIVGSFVSGNLVSVAADGTATSFGTAGSNVTGIEVDEERGRVLAAVMALPSGQAKLAIHELDTGAQQDLIDLGALVDEGDLFANDIAIGPDGTAYVTNTGAGVIFAVDLDGNPSIFAKDPRFDAIQSGQQSSGLNGIVSTGDALLVGHTPTGKIYRLSFDDPSTVTEVDMPNPLPGIDGMTLSADGAQLATVSGAASTALLLGSADGWATASPLGSFATGENFPTAVTATPDGFRVLYAHLDQLATQSASQFEIVTATFAQPDEDAAAELAVTGPSQSTTLALIGAVLVVAGIVIVRSGRRFGDSREASA